MLDLLTELFEVLTIGSRYLKIPDGFVTKPGGNADLAFPLDVYSGLLR